MREYSRQAPPWDDPSIIAVASGLVPETHNKDTVLCETCQVAWDPEFSDACWLCGGTWTHEWGVVERRPKGVVWGYVVPKKPEPRPEVAPWAKDLLGETPFVGVPF